ncbi:MAG: beta-galactosidase [Deltaproteobacteria bacterium]|nr:beta-galactosidase [Deltaproteobacteria bacterium]
MHRRAFLRSASVVPALSLPLAARAGQRDNKKRFAHLPKAPDAAFTLGVQYYRAPFPEQQHWESDIARMKDAGLNTVQLWVMWPWVEAQPGKFVFDDYDRLVELVAKNGLGLVVSTIAEVHPHWIHKVVPGSEMIDHMGIKVISSNRAESHFGLTPGGCFDNPGVWQHQRRFIETVVGRYRHAPHLRAWDIWNETRWNVQSENFVCFCPHTLKAFRAWLDKRYGGLPGLNEAWKRRYGRWDEVMPGKLPQRTYTEMMAWTHFITERSNNHASARYALFKKLDKDHPATLHGPSPCETHQGKAASFGYPLDRGNDFAFADVVDGVGSSVFPTWWQMDDTELAVFATHVKSAARGKQAWFSEVQGGRASQGAEPHEPVTPADQQKWIWGAIAGGIDTVLFWCWRDEIFGGESGGYGLVGNDGQADHRLQAMRKTSGLLARHKDLIRAYQPTTPKVGVFFSPQSFYLLFAQTGAGYPPRRGIGYCARALTRASIPWRTVEEDHLDGLAGLSVLLMPRGLVTDEKVEAALMAFVEQGGTLVVEAECGAYTRQGFYHPPQERFLAKRCGLREVGRRSLPKGNQITVKLNGHDYVLPVEQWLAPLDRSGLPAGATVLCDSADGPLVTDTKVGRGRVIHIGAYVAEAQRDNWTQAFEDFVAHVVASTGVVADAEVVAPVSSRTTRVIVRSGRSGNAALVFVLGPPNTEFKLSFRDGLFSGAEAHDIISDRPLRLQGRLLTLPLSPWGLHVLRG